MVGPADHEALLRQAIERVASAALALPDAYEEDAWIGVRWRIRTRTFAHWCTMAMWSILKGDGRCTNGLKAP